MEIARLLHTFGGPILALFGGMGARSVATLVIGMGQGRKTIDFAPAQRQSKLCRPERERIVSGDPAQTVRFVYHSEGQSLLGRRLDLPAGQVAHRIRAERVRPHPGRGGVGHRRGRARQDLPRGGHLRLPLRFRRHLGRQGSRSANTSHSADPRVKQHRDRRMPAGTTRPRQGCFSGTTRRTDLRRRA